MARRPISAEAMDADSAIALSELCSLCGVDADWVLDLVAEGIVEPAGRNRGGPYFTALAVRRVQVVRRLQRDLGVNRAGAGLAVELLDEVHILRRRIQVLEAQFQDEASPRRR